ncbi:hypothetical protein BH24ACT3_BH24ACT3_14530 [soil metagenome]
MSAARPSTTGPRPWWRREAGYFLEVLALTGFAVAQPVLAAFGESPETFGAAGASPLGIVACSMAVVFVPALVVWAVTALSGAAGPRARDAAQAVVIGILVTLFVSWAARDVLAARRWELLLAAAVGGLVVLLYRRFSAARLYLAFASAAPAIFLAVFLGFSPVANLVRSPDPATGSLDAEEERPSMVVLVLDELPTASLLDDEDRIDADLFPHLAAFADDATLYRNHTSVATFTDAAIPALLTGRYPTGLDADRRAYAENLFTLLGDGYDLNVHESITSLCPPSSCQREVDPAAVGSLGVQAWELWTSLLTARSGPAEMAAASTAPPDRIPVDGDEDWLAGLDRAIDDRVDRLDGFVESIGPVGATPRLDFAHVLLPHVPWNLGPDGHPYEADEPPLGNIFRTWGSESGALLGRQRHLLQLQYLDQRVGDVLDRLAEFDRYDESLVAIIADHGISFAQGQSWRGVTEHNQSELLWTPLLIKVPGQREGRLDETNTESIDLVPTIAAVASVDIPWEVDGRSVLGGDGGGREPKWIFPSLIDELEPEGGEDLVRIDADDGYRRMLALPPASAVPGDDPLALYRLPPYLDLAGTPVAELTEGDPASWAARLDDPDRYEIDRGSPAPIYVSGVAEGATTGPTDLAVAVNGVVGGWGHLESDMVEDVTRFAVLVPESLFRAGDNTIEVFELDGSSRSPQLGPVEIE